MSLALRDLLGRLTTSELAVLAAATELAAQSPDGQVAGGLPALTQAVGLSDRGVRKILAALEARGLVRRRGQTNNRRLFVVVLRNTGAASGGATGSGDFRELRARVGGLQRAIKEAITARERAEAEMQAMRAERRAKRLEANAPLAAMLADLDHATDCLDVDCERCRDIACRIEAERPEYTTEAELAGRLEHAESITQAGQTLIQAMRDQGVGAASRRAHAFRSFAALLEHP